jgi:hypothetical protein
MTNMTAINITEPISGLSDREHQAVLAGLLLLRRDSNTLSALKLSAEDVDALCARLHLPPTVAEPAKNERCPTCGRPVVTIFDHLGEVDARGQECELWDDPT